MIYINKKIKEKDMSVDHNLALMGPYTPPRRGRNDKFAPAWSPKPNNERDVSELCKASSRRVAFIPDSAPSPAASGTYQNTNRQYRPITPATANTESNEQIKKPFFSKSTIIQIKKVLNFLKNFMIFAAAVTAIVLGWEFILGLMALKVIITIICSIAAVYYFCQTAEAWERL